MHCELADSREQKDSNYPAITGLHGGIRPSFLNRHPLNKFFEKKT